MKSLRRLVGALTLLLSAVGIVGCVVGIIGTWMLSHRVSVRVQKIASGLDAGLQRASDVSQTVQRLTGKARADVAQVRKESADLDNGREKRSRASRALRTLVQQQLGPDVEDLGGRLATLADAAVAVSSVLQSFQGLPSSRTNLIKPDQLERWADEVQGLSAALRRLESMVGEGDKETSGREIAAATSEIDLALQRSQAQVDDWQTNVDAFREQMEDVKAELLGWLTPAAIALTLLLAWVGLGQLSLFARGLQWCRGV
jgi:hypothetical protein